MPEQLPVTLHGLFERQARLTPDRPAVEDDISMLTYAKLDHCATALAARLGVGSGSVVGVATPRSLHTAVAVLGVLKAGAAYLPLDLTYPRARTAAMLEHSRASVVVSTPDMLGGLVLPTGVSAVDVSDNSGQYQAIRAHRETASSTDLAYVIYTSGSTGEPKGVAMPHRGPLNLVRWQRHRPGARPPGRTLHFSAMSFDVAVQELFDTWAGGGTLVIVGEETRRDPERLAAALRERQVERVFMPYVALQSLATALEDQPPPPWLREVVTAGEQLVITPAIRAFFRRLRNCTLENQYGPTETHVATAYRLAADPATWPDLPSIGHPIDGLTAYVLDGDLKPVRPGMAGELFLAGIGVARGYLHRPGLTAERFLTAPDGDVMYRTGDLVATGEEGLHFLGRIDDQIKVAGHRVEPGEVEAVLLTHSAVREAAVVARLDGTGAKRLIAYATAPSGEVGPSELRDFVAARLPPYMIPDSVQVLDNVPRTPSGKLDRRSLPTPRYASREDHEPARTPTERALRAIAVELLGLDGIGVTNRLREFGADSLLLVRLHARIRQEFEVDLRLAAVFEAETVRALADAVDSAPRMARYDGSDVIDPEAPALASEQQRQFWLLNRIASGQPAYNEGLVARLDGELDEQAFADAVRALAVRYPVLRSTLVLSGGQLKAEPHAAEDVRVTVKPISPHQLREAVRAAVREPFDLSCEVPLRAWALQTAPRAWTLVLVFHHAAFDGWSIQYILDTFTVSYAAAVGGGSPSVPSASAGYAAYARWQRSTRLEGSLGWWVRSLEGVTQEMSFSPTRARPARPSFQGGRLREPLPPQAVSQVRTVARQEGVSSYVVLLAAFAAHVAEITRRDDLVVGVPAANRLLPEHESVVGPFVNTLPLRLRLHGDGVDEQSLVRRTHMALAAALEHQHVPFPRVVSALGAGNQRSPLVQVLFTAAPLVRRPQRLGEAPVKWDLDPLERDVAVLDLNLTIRDEGDEIVADLEYATDLFSLADARDIFNGWLRCIT